jgi:hypothetical protein
MIMGNDTEKTGRPTDDRDLIARAVAEAERRGMDPWVRDTSEGPKIQINGAWFTPERAAEIMGLEPVADVFAKLVESWERTCQACPAQFEGRLRSGLAFYFRFRWGTAYLSVGTTPEDAVRDTLPAATSYGGDLDGELTDDQFKDLFVRLAPARIAQYDHRNRPH